MARDHDFGSAAVEFADDPDAPGTEPVTQVIDQDDDGPAEPRPPLWVRVCGWAGDLLCSRLERWHWSSTPQLPLSLLVDHALTGEWTTSGKRRAGLWWWLRTAGFIGRGVAYVPLWLWLRKDTPPSGGDLPPVVELVDRAREEGGSSLVWIWPVAAGRVVSLWLDSPAVSGVAFSCSWLGVNFANETSFDGLIPDEVTGKYWAYRIGSASVAFGRWVAEWAPIGGKVAGSVVVVAALLFAVYQFFFNGDKNASQTTPNGVRRDG